MHAREQRTGAGSRDGNGELVLRLVGVAEKQFDVLHQFQEIRIEVPNLWERHRRMDAGVRVPRPWTAQEARRRIELVDLGDRHLLAEVLHGALGLVLNVELHGSTVSVDHCVAVRRRARHAARVRAHMANEEVGGRRRLLAAAALRHLRHQHRG